MSSNTDDEYRLASIDQEEEEIGLAPIQDEDKRIIAPDVPYDTEMRLIPVVCSACKTRLYATENQVGMWKECPDCLRLTEIRAVDPQFLYTVELSENGGYVVKKPEIESRPTANIGVDYRTVDGYQKPEFIPQRVFLDEQPKMEALLDGLLQSNKEKERIRKEKEREAKIEEEMRLAKKAKLEGKVDNPLERLIAEKEMKARGEKAVTFPATSGGENRGAQRWRDEKNLGSQIPKPPPAPHSGAEQGAGPVPIPPKRNREPAIVSKPDRPEMREKEESSVSYAILLPLSETLEPFLSSVNRKKMVMLLALGYLANFCLEGAKTLFGQAILDSHPDGPGHIMSWGEMGLFSVSFFAGAFLGIVWLILILMFGFNLFTKTSTGMVQVERWMQFDLQMGFSYIFWTALVFWVSFYPGVFLIWGLDAVFPSFRETAYVLHRLGIMACSPFFTFPILFLCIAETDTFFKGWPKKTIQSLFGLPLLWCRFYFSVLLLVGLPILLVVGLAFLNLCFRESPMMQSVFYYFVVAGLEAVLLGFCPLLYFRLLGKLFFIIDEDFDDSDDEE